MTAIATALGTADAAAGLEALDRVLGLTQTLQDLGLRDADIDRAAEMVSEASYPNPRPVTADDVRSILRGA